MSSQTPNPLEPKPIDDALAATQPDQSRQSNPPAEPAQQPSAPTAPDASALPAAPAAPAASTAPMAPPRQVSQDQASQHEAPQYQAPQYQTPQPGYQGGGQPPHGAQPGHPAAGTAENTATNVQLNYWLSVFLFWIPALIFYLIERGKSPVADKFNRDNLNFTLVRTIVGVGTWLFSGIPVLGWLITIACSIAGLVLFVFHLVAAIKVKENYERGQDSGFLFNIDIVK